MKPEHKLVDVKQFLIRKKTPPVWGVEELDDKRNAALKILGERWLLHPKHSSKKGDYNGWPKK